MKESYFLLSMIKIWALPSKSRYFEYDFNIIILDMCMKSSVRIRISKQRIFTAFQNTMITLYTFITLAALHIYYSGYHIGP